MASPGQVEAAFVEGFGVDSRRVATTTRRMLLDEVAPRSLWLFQGAGRRSLPVRPFHVVNLGIAVALTAPPIEAPDIVRLVRALVPGSATATAIYDDGSVTPLAAADVNDVLAGAGTFGPVLDRIVEDLALVQDRPFTVRAAIWLRPAPAGELILRDTTTRTDETGRRFRVERRLAFVEGADLLPLAEHADVVVTSGGILEPAAFELLAELGREGAELVGKPAPKPAPRQRRKNRNTEIGDGDAPNKKKAADVGTSAAFETGRPPGNYRSYAARRSGDSTRQLARAQARVSSSGRPNRTAGSSPGVQGVARAHHPDSPATAE